MWVMVFEQLTPDGFFDIGLFAPDIFQTRIINTERFQ